MSRFEKSVEVGVPVRVAYDKWTQFEDFPRFMEGVERVVQLDDKHLRWTASIAGKRKDWEAEIVDQTPDTRIAWKSTQGAENAGAVFFEALGQDRTILTLRMDAEPHGLIETAGDALGFLQRQVEGDLKRFKEQIEDTESDSEGWRGEIHGDDVSPDPASTSGAANR
ncbi:MAG: SRPBCC family protein [Chloroflexi bacterium]|nr:SRPBCC family protein [Chloroflexota bacterium]